MTDCKTICLSYEDISLLSAALSMAEARETADADHYEHSSNRYEACGADEEYRDKLLLAAADCRERAREYRRVYKALWEEVRGT